MNSLALPDSRPWSKAAYPIWALVSGYAGEKRRKRLIGMVTHQVFIDESGKGQEIFVSAGFISTAEKWAAFSDEWALALAQSPKIAYLKMSDAAAIPSKGEFANFSQEEIFAKIALLSSVIEKYAEKSFFVALKDADFREVFAGKISPTLNSPDFFAHFGLINVALATQYQRRGVLGKVDFIFDEMSPAAIDDIRRQWRLLKETGEAWQRRRMGDEPQMRSEKDILPLQAADLLAWVIHNGLDAKNRHLKTFRAESFAVPALSVVHAYYDRAHPTKTGEG